MEDNSAIMPANLLSDEMLLRSTTLGVGDCCKLPPFISGFVDVSLYSPNRYWVVRVVLVHRNECFIAVRSLLKAKLYINELNFIF